MAVTRSYTGRNALSSPQGVVAGLGLFATAPVAAATVVSRLSGGFVSTAELHDVFAAAANDPEHPYIDTWGRWCAPIDGFMPGHG